MKENINYKAIGKGLYKVAFCLCILVLSVITIVITENYNKALDDNANYASTVIHSEKNISEKKIEDNTVEQKFDNYADSEMILDSYNIEYIQPVQGDVIKEFSFDIPIYSKTMDDWRIHTGVDISSPYGTAIVAIERGVVLNKGYDLNLGYFIEIKHGDIVCRYMSLESDISLSEGDLVNRGDVVGYLSDSAIGEICDELHLHFEMKKSDEYVNPMDYIY